MLDPQAIVTREPLNAHTPVEALAQPRTPTDAFFVRNHFAVPRIPPGEWRLEVKGAVERERTLALQDVLGLPQKTLDVVLECAGNGRTRMRPLPPGTPWGERAVACASFTGARLRDALEDCGIEPGTAELVFSGADEGDVHGERIRFERSLPLASALAEDVLLCHAMNGAPLTPEHGAPVRLLVPRWYGVASVKWLTGIRAVTEPFEGYYQADHYVYRDNGDGTADRPVTRLRVKSLVTEPAQEKSVRAGERVQIAGYAWSGEAPIERVEVSADNGRSWEEARLEPEEGRHAWRRFTHEWVAEGQGPRVLLVRAVDADGHEQPLEPVWNALGYGNNEVARARFSVA